jgi:hypothetical protein
MYHPIQKTYTDLSQPHVKEKDGILSNILIITDPEGPMATGPLSSSPQLRWEDLKFFWKEAVQRIYNPWYAVLRSTLTGNTAKRVAAIQQTNKILEVLAQELETRYPQLSFEFIIATPAGIVRALGGHFSKDLKTLLGLAEAFTGKILCVTRTYDEQDENLTDFFTAGLDFFNKTSGTSFCHILQVAVGRQ